MYSIYVSSSEKFYYHMLFPTSERVCANAHHLAHALVMKLKQVSHSHLCINRLNMLAHARYFLWVLLGSIPDLHLSVTTILKTSQSVVIDFVLSEFLLCDSLYQRAVLLDFCLEGDSHTLLPVPHQTWMDASISDGDTFTDCKDRRLGRNFTCRLSFWNTRCIRLFEASWKQGIAAVSFKSLVGRMSYFTQKISHVPSERNYFPFRLH